MGESLSLKQSFCVHKLVLLAKNICGYERMCVRGRGSSTLLSMEIKCSNLLVYVDFFFHDLDPLEIGRAHV